jgi:two-component system, OmpR family, sensor histidine kinase KdpD
MGRHDEDHRRPDPDQLLRQVQAEERQVSRGRLKVFLGYASGVGKSLRMFDEGRRRKMRGEDVVVAASQSSAPAEVEGLLRGFEVIPTCTESGHSAIDVEAVRKRRPKVVLIDGLAYENPPGSKHPERWQDVEELLAAGVSVITSINLQYVKEKQAQVEALRGKRTRESVPESFLRTADEIEVVDAPPEYTLTRSLRGGGVEEADIPRQERQLSELREIALLFAAEVVDYQLGGYLQRHGIAQVFGTHERILVCITPRSNASVMIRRCRRQADRFHGDLHVVYVQQDGLGPEDEASVAQNLASAREARARVQVLHGTDAARAILDYARTHGITQIFVGHSRPGARLARFRPSLVERLIQEADGIDVRIFPRE